MADTIKRVGRPLRYGKCKIQDVEFVINDASYAHLKDYSLDLPPEPKKYDTKPPLIVLELPRVRGGYKPRTIPFGPKRKNGRPKKIVEVDSEPIPIKTKTKKDPLYRNIINEDLYIKKINLSKANKKLAIERSKFKDLTIKREPTVISISI